MHSVETNETAGKNGAEDIARRLLGPGAVYESGQMRAKVGLFAVNGRWVIAIRAGLTAPERREHIWRALRIWLAVASVEVAS